MKTTVSLLVGLLCWSAVESAPVTHWFEKANKAYSEGNYDTAASYYERILESGMDNAAVLFNYGNTLYRLKKIGRARLAYEQAARLAPDDDDIAANIRFIQSNIIDRVPEPERGLLDTILWKLHIFLPLKTQLWVAFAILCCISLGISLSFFAPRNQRLWLIYLSVLFGLLFLATGSSIGYKIYQTENVSYAIVLSTSIDAKNEPKGTTIRFTAHEGTRFRIRKMMDDWALVSLPNGLSGWVERKHLGII